MRSTLGWFETHRYIQPYDCYDWWSWKGFCMGRWFWSKILLSFCSSFLKHTEELSRYPASNTVPSSTTSMRHSEAKGVWLSPSVGKKKRKQNGKNLFVARIWCLLKPLRYFFLLSTGKDAGSSTRPGQGFTSCAVPSSFPPDSFEWDCSCGEDGQWLGRCPVS